MSGKIRVITSLCPPTPHYSKGQELNRDPSSPTPQHLRKHKLSFLDQQATPTYISLLFFYDPPSSNQSIIDLSQNLKQSLSRVLTKFYPLAGRIVDGYVDCNDEGVEYVETRVHARMSDLTVDPDPVELQKYVWNQSMGEKVINPLSIQVSTFDCGGVAVGPCMSHKIGDMASFVMFMNDWSTACRNEEVLVGPPDFGVLSSRFPPHPDDNNIVDRGRHDDDHEDDDVVISKRFVFDKGMLSELKRVGSSREVENPSRVEVVTAFLWGSLAFSRRMQLDRSVVLHVVNVRSHDESAGFGNGCAPAVARWSFAGDEGESVISTMIAELRAAIRAAKIKVVCDREGASEVDWSVKFDCTFSSWCRFPMYSVDYGWGQPSWVARVVGRFENFTVFMDTKDGDGVEAWVDMVETDMAVVELNYDRLHRSCGRRSNSSTFSSIVLCYTKFVVFHMCNKFVDC